MVTSHEILAATGLKSARTLARWANEQIIPQPRIGTHPSGRGKIAFWPRWVMDFCVKIVELRKSGYSVKEAAQAIKFEQAARKIEEEEKEPFLSEQLDSNIVTLRSGKKVSLLDVVTTVIFDSLKGIMTDPVQRKILLMRFREGHYLDLALEHIKAGYNPLLFFSGDEVKVLPDFMLAHMFNQRPLDIKTGYVLSLLAPLKKAFSVLGKELKTDNLACPAPRIWIRQGKDLMQYGIWLVGDSDFELIRESAQKVGGKEDETDKN